MKPSCFASATPLPHDLARDDPERRVVSFDSGFLGKDVARISKAPTR